MRFRRRLTFVFSFFITLSITVSISFAILFIREHLYADRLAQMRRQADRTYAGLALAANAPLPALAAASEYHLAAFGPDAAPRYTNLPADLALPFFPPGAGYQLLQTEDYLLLHARYPHPRQGVSVLVLAYPKRAVREALKPIRWIIYTGMLVSSVLGLVIIVIFAHYLSRPIQRIKQTTARIAAGNFDLLARESRRTDELGDIARAINRMSEHLKADNERLKELNEQQQQFYADITHEVRNPLHTILTSLDMLELVAEQPEKRKQYLGILRSQAERIARLFQDLVTLQKYEADAAFIRPAWFPLDDVLRRVELAYADRFAAAGLDYQVEYPAKEVYADADKIEQVLDNLVSNALKFTERGGVRITCRPQGDKLCLGVQDTGVGVAPEHLARLTDRFYRTDKARTRDKGGTGLGLSVVKSILEAHGATLDLASTPGAGSTFSFCLPMKA